MNRQIYLDYNATAPLKGEVIEAVRAALERTGNPSSVHGFGREARRALERARAAVAAMVGAAPSQVVFTSGGTEANNQALCGSPGGVVVSAVEHDSVLAAVPDAERAVVDREGRVDLARLDHQLGRAAPALVSVMLANNETGVVQPVREVVEVARRHGARVHCDAVQAGGKLPIDMAALGVDFLTLSAHKFGGPQGVGALVVGVGIEPAALLRGGGQERRWRPGTENLAGIVGFGRACELAMADTGWRRRTDALRDRLEEEIKAIAPAARVFGRGAERLS
ncbi:MAG TPA: aminotransferase class V-fold PLP-dependent enzyme, partial [Geminicoccaceae bacterium]|nr:aminotransferase class V-fold PLP-dependent enzyme [Geminicoccaceae bacterium]